MSVFFSLDPTSLLLGGVVLLSALWWLSTRRPPGLPPGPGPALPLLGHLYMLAQDPRAQFREWRRQYGDVFSLYMGSKLVVVLASYSSIREALVTFGDVFSDRPQTLVQEIYKNRGIANASGKVWKTQRKTTTEILRAMGMGKNVLAEKIQEEITHYIRAIRDHQGAPVDLARMNHVSISNNICSITLGKRFDYQDAEFTDFVQQNDHMLKLISGTGLLYFFPILRYLPGDPFKMQEFIALNHAVLAFIGGHLVRHKKALEEKSEEIPENADFLYNYLRQIKKTRTDGDLDASLDEEHLQTIGVELFVAGTHTTYTALQWALLFFLHHPHVQDKCFQEISDVIGPCRQPAISDRPKLPYMEATVQEVLRKGDVAPLSLQHATASDVTFRGYTIPKGTVIIPSLSSALQDPEMWGDPENFRPERFIDAEGKVTRNEELIPFGTGRRVCVGESMARMELFLYLATLIQHFRFLPAEEEQLPSTEQVLGIVCNPHPYKIRAVPRM